MKHGMGVPLWLTSRPEAYVGADRPQDRRVELIGGFGLFCSAAKMIWRVLA